MLASSFASEISYLEAIIQACWILATISLAVWCSVFLVRSHRLRRMARDAAAEEELTGLVLDRLSGYRAEDAARTFDALPEWKRRVLLRVLRNLIMQTTGSDQRRLIELLEKSGFQRQTFDALTRYGGRQRQEACEILGHFTDPDSIDALQTALGDRDSAVRLTAAQALLRAGG